MKRILSIVCLALLTIGLWAQKAETEKSEQQTFRGRVVDAETGEPLPYASVYVAEGKGTLTNEDGEFTLVTDNIEKIKVTYLGYQTKLVSQPTTDLHIKMKPLSKQLREIEVYGVDINKVLRRTIRRLKKDYRKNIQTESIYFFRTILGRPKSIPDLAEGFLVAKSAVNIRGPIFINGQCRSTVESSIRNIRRTNIQRLFSLSARMKGLDFWERIMLPLQSFSSAKSLYATTGSSFKNDEGRRIYVLDMHYTGKLPDDLQSPPIMEGKIYVDSATYRLLRFDGISAYMAQRVNANFQQATVKTHIEYDYSAGYGKVSLLAAEGGNDLFTYKYILFKVDDTDGKKYYGKQNNDLVRALENVKYDTSYWDKYNIVQRTKEEEEIVRKATEQGLFSADSISQRK